MKLNKYEKENIIVTAGSTYLDIDAYACCVAMAELLNLQGIRAVAYSTAPNNYSVCSFLTTDVQIARTLPDDYDESTSKYIIVDVSDPEFLKDSVSLDRVTEVYDHHVGFEEYWKAKIGSSASIEFIGAAATLIFREWEKAGLLDKMARTTAMLLVAAILDNTLNLTSSNTTEEDVEVFDKLCAKAQIGSEWCAAYFSKVQQSVEADLKNALFNDIKHFSGDILPSRIAQLCVWDADRVLDRLSEIRRWFEDDDWMINVIDINHQCSYFVCDDKIHQKQIEKVFDVLFEKGVAKTETTYLRKQIIKKTLTVYR